MTQHILGVDGGQTSTVAVESVCFGMTGGAEFVPQVAPKFIDAQKLSAVHDVVTALAGTKFAAPDIVVIAGTGAGSTVVGAFILNALLTEVIERLNSSGEIPPIFISANLPGAQAHNERLYERYRARNPHL